MGLRCLKEQPLDQFLFRHLQILCNISQNSMDCAELDWIVVGNRYEMFSAGVCASQADVAASLADSYIAKDVQCTNEIRATKVAGTFTRR